MKYRAEIDGLRAFAVIPVILFHAGFELFRGGFVGVDVFFVISGYLITTILIEDIENQRFSIVNFYERRARRILPALFFVMLVCIPFAWMWMLPNQVEDFSHSLVAVSLFASNILWARESGYFAAAAEEKPLLHTWSLAVEEQYYVLFPIFLILAWRFGKNRVLWMIVVTAAISLLLSEWGWRNKASANFYLSPTRAWELFAGSIAAFVVQKHGVRKNNLLSLIGLAAIIFSIFFYDETTPFPSVYALIPVLGVVLLVLYADKETLAAKLLSTKGFVGVGLISYSAYLWHQPLFSFARIISSNTFPTVIYSSLVIVSFGLAYLSWRYIEQPFRSPKVSTKFIFTFSIVMLSAFIGAGLYGHFSKGFPNRYTSPQLNMLEPARGDSSRCHNKLKATEIADGKRCKITTKEDFKVDIAVIGDSHAAALTDALSIEIASMKRGFFTFTGNWCAPLMHFTTNTQGKDGCLDEINNAYQQILNDENIKSIILHAEWANYLKGFRWGEDKNHSVYLFNKNNVFDFKTAKLENNFSELEKAIRFTFESLSKSKKDVLIILSVPEFEFKVPQMLNPKAPFIKKELLHLPLISYENRSGEVNNLLVKYARKYEFYIYNPAQHMCDTQYCFSHDDYGSFYQDGNHLSLYGASKIAPHIAKILD